jgi:hypothetical protein
MDAEGARALARRIEQGPPDEAPAPAPREDDPRPRQIFGLSIVRTVRTPIVVDGRRAVLDQRLHSRLVEGRWATTVVSESVHFSD